MRRELLIVAEQHDWGQETRTGFVLTMAVAVPMSRTVPIAVATQIGEGCLVSALHAKFFLGAVTKDFTNAYTFDKLNRITRITQTSQGSGAGFRCCCQLAC